MLTAHCCIYVPVSSDLPTFPAPVGSLDRDGGLLPPVYFRGLEVLFRSGKQGAAKKGCVVCTGRPGGGVDRQRQVFYSVLLFAVYVYMTANPTSTVGSDLRREVKPYKTLSRDV